MVALVCTSASMESILTLESKAVEVLDMKVKTKVDQIHYDEVQRRRVAFIENGTHLARYPVHLQIKMGDGQLVKNSYGVDLYEGISWRESAESFCREQKLDAVVCDKVLHGFDAKVPEFTAKVTVPSMAVPVIETRPMYRIGLVDNQCSQG